MNNLYSEEYTNWFADNKEQLKKDFVNSFSKEDLSESIVVASDDPEEYNFFLIHEQTFSDFCEDMFVKEQEVKEVEQ